MATPTPRIRMASTATPGQVIEVKTLIAHEMESGQRKDVSGRPIPRKIIKAFTAKFEGQEIFRSEWYPAVSANPYLAFYVRVPHAGTFEFSWFDDDGTVYKAEQAVAVG